MSQTTTPHSRNFINRPLETPHTADLLLRLVDSDTYRIEEIPANPGTTSLRLSEPRRLVLGLVHDAQVTLGIDDDPVVQPDDRLLVLSLPAPGDGS